MGHWRRISSSQASKQERLAGILLMETREEIKKLPAPTAPHATADSQSQATAECKDMKDLRVKKLVLGEATDAETDVDDAVARVVAAAVGRTAVRGVGVPRPAAQQSSFGIVGAVVHGLGG